MKLESGDYTSCVAPVTVLPTVNLGQKGVAVPEVNFPRY